ncbi:hypothetical protein [Alloalcanivorax xenomutans]|uniref:hypothetical protein n=1 Tax=Alloalcanivorax xenomutans TaxID=1094342 RepID=UPI0024E2238C|nr:hypothetical protein [Alloalcanivorax xenomutans]
MSVHRFVAPTQREAMRRVREALGDDALIVANRQVPGGVELVALREGEDTPASPPSGEALPMAEGDADVSRLLLKEVETLRALLRRRERGEGAADSPLAATLRGAGFSAALITDVLAGLPEEAGEGDAARAWVEQQLARRLDAQARPWDKLAEGGVLALVGPTGVGKTTTAGKLASHYAMRWGADQVALVSADGYRVAARDQLRVYAELLGVDLHLLSPGRTLASLAGVLNDKRLVIIDTVGLGQRDERLAEGFAPLVGGARSTRAVLLLNAASQAETLDEVSTHYRRAARQAGMTLDDVIITKSDEAARLAPLLDVVIGQGLRPWFQCDGQRVPEDLAPLDGVELVRQALNQGDCRTGGALPFNPLAQTGTLVNTLADLRRDVPGFSWLEQALAGQWQRQPPLPRGDETGWLFWPAARDEAALVLGKEGEAWPLWPPEEASRIRCLQWCRRHYPSLMPVLSGVPQATVWRWLDRQAIDWMARVQAQARVRYRGDIQPLWALREQAPELGEALLRQKGRTLRVSLRALPVAAASGRRYSGLVRAWFLQARDPETDRVRGWRYALLPNDWDLSRARPHLLALWRGQAVAGLSQRAMRELPAGAALSPGDSSPSSSRYASYRSAAAGLAALACRLDEEQSDWAVATRGRVLGLLGPRRRRTPERLLTALLHVIRTHDALRLMRAS